MDIRKKDEMKDIKQQQDMQNYIKLTIDKVINCINEMEADSKPQTRLRGGANTKNHSITS